MTEISSPIGGGTSRAWQHVAGLDLLASLAQNALMRADDLILASSRETVLAWSETQGFEEDLAKLAKAPMVLDRTAIDRVNEGLRAFDAKISSLDNRAQTGLEIMSHLAYQSIVSGVAPRWQSVEQASAALDRFFSQEADAGGPESVSAAMRLGELQTASQRPRREWLANVVTVAAVLAIVVIALILIGTVF